MSDAYTSDNQSMYIDINEIQKQLLPLSKKRLRKFVQDRFHVIRAGNKLLVERKQLMEYLQSQDVENLK